MDKIRIEKIIEPTKEILDITTKWMYDWWGIEEHYQYDDVYTYMKNSYNMDKLPQTFVMYKDDQIIGIYQLTYRDLFIRPDIYPWVANIYIDKKYRNKGYSKQLIGSIKDQVKENTQFNTIYLYTSHTNLYEQYGWEYIETMNKNVKLYKLKIR